MKQTSPRRMREMPDIRERECSEETVETIIPKTLLVSDHERSPRTHPDTIVLVFPHSTERRLCCCWISELGMDPSQSISHWTSC